MQKITSLLIIIIFSSTLFSQVVTNEIPPSFTKAIYKNFSSSINLTPPNVNTLVLEDAIEVARNNKPWRFGTLINTNLNLLNSGNWTYDDNLGTATWILKIHSANAKSLNLNFNDFELAPTAKLFIYTNKNNILGAITAKNNKVDRQFSTSPFHPVAGVVWCKLFSLK